MYFQVENILIMFLFEKNLNLFRFLFTCRLLIIRGYCRIARFITISVLRSQLWNRTSRFAIRSLLIHRYFVVLCSTRYFCGDLSNLTIAIEIVRRNSHSSYLTKCAFVSCKRILTMMTLNRSAGLRSILSALSITAIFLAEQARREFKDNSPECDSRVKKFTRECFNWRHITV